MISTERRGQQEAMQRTRHYAPSYVQLSDDMLALEGERVWNHLQAKGYAHIDPRAEFIAGYVVGVKHILAYLQWQREYE